MRFVPSIKGECLNRIVPLGEVHLRRRFSEYVEPYRRERKQPGLDNVLVEPLEAANGTEKVVRHPRLGGLLSFYHREAA
jgi:hypothetical protein